MAPNIEPEVQPAASSPCAAAPPGDRSARFAYNTIFFPEFISIIVISVAISWVAFQFPPKGARPLALNPHAPPALAAYLALMLLLIGKMLFDRRRYAPVSLVIDPPGHVTLQSGGTSLELRLVDRIEERMGTLFGRKARYCRVDGASGESIEFNDGLFEYDELRDTVRRLAPQASFPEPIDTEQLVAAGRTWEERHKLFSRGYGWRFLNIVSRLFCLVPVAFFDLLITVAMIQELTRRAQPDLQVYISPISLVVSAFLARYLYYYLFTNITLNRSSTT